MVHHRMRSRRVGVHGGSARPQVAQSSEPASPSPPHENPPPPSLPHRHYPHAFSEWGRVQASIAEHSNFRLHTATFPLPPSSAPHSMQFKFRSNLNKPIITVNITVVFSEDSKQHDTPLGCSKMQHQEERSHGIGHDFGLLPGEEGRGLRSGSLHVEGGRTDDSWQPGCSLVGASILMPMAGSTSGTLPAREPQGGVAEADEVWYHYACRIAEETPDQYEPK